MSAERTNGSDGEPPKDFPNSEIEVIGSGNVGEKAQQLITKTPTLRRLGFYTPPRVVFAEGFFDEFFQRNGLGSSLQSTRESPALQSQVRNGNLSLEQFSTLCRVASSFGDNPVVVRSSAQGDARGTGTYKSVFTENKPGEVRKAVLEVLASYFSESAVAFRRDAQTGEGMGILVEPLIGQLITDEFSSIFAPLLSGFGYTSTLRGEGYVNVVPGIGGV